MAGIGTERRGQSVRSSVSTLNVRGPFSLDSVDELTSVLNAGGLKDVAVRVVKTPMRAASLNEWWERVPKLAGPLAMALADMEPDVRKAVADRAMQAGTATPGTDGIVFTGSVLIGSGLKPPA